MAELGGNQARVIVLGNEKGGTGKSTTAMHLIVGLIRDGHRVASIDVDGHQATLSRYVENRRSFSDAKDVRLPTPEHFQVAGSNFENASDAREDERARLDGLLEDLSERSDYIVIDCPGNDTFLARHALSAADVLITPINDSFIDLDLLAKVGGSPPQVLGPSVYSQTVWEQKQERARTTRRTLDWIVLRNRLSPLASRNSQNVGTTVDQLATRIGFRTCDGFFERVVFRQLFLQGLTVLDLRDEGTEVKLNMSHLAARREVKRLIDAVKGPETSEDTSDQPMSSRLVVATKRFAAGSA